MDANGRTPGLLIVEDDTASGIIISQIANRVGFAPKVARSFAELGALVRERTWDCVTLDLSIDFERSGLDILRLLSEQGCTAPIIIISAATETQCAMAMSRGRMLNLRLLEALHKPFDLGELHKALANVRAGLEVPA